MGSCWSMQVKSSNHQGSSAQTTSDSRRQEKKSISNERWPLPTPDEGAGGSGSGGGGGIAQELPPSGHIVTPNLKMFRFAELKEATRNFQPHTMLGEGGFGQVFKGWVNPNTLAPTKVGVGVPVAVKRSKPDSAQGLKEWQAEVKFLGKFSHPNLVKLLGYCWENKEFLLVYEYMQKGSLENHLFRREETLPWDTRMKIAVGAARGLKFLHTTEKTVIYRDFKSANILLDGEFNPKLSDFGLAKLGPANGESHISTGIVGTYGYAAPEYVATGHLYVKSDVFGFGVVLLEIITGLRVLDDNRPNAERNLVDWTRPILLDKRKFKTMVDPRLEDDYPSKGAHKAAELIRRCLEPDPKNRPSMEEVLLDLEQIIAMKMKPKETKINRGRSVGHMHGQKLGENGRVSLRSPSTTSS